MQAELELKQFGPVGKLSAVLHHPEACSFFRSFAVKMMCPENLDFWLRAQVYRNSWCGDTSMTATLKQARRDEAYYESLIMICRDAHDVREAAANSPRAALARFSEGDPNL